MSAPVVLVTADRRTPEGFHDGPRIRPKRAECWVLEAYVDAVRRCGGLPLLVPPGHWDADALLDSADALLITGGDHDIDPCHYGETVKAPLGRIEPLRTHIELALARAALLRHVPVLGICGGAQVLAVAGGGRLIQDLSVAMGEAGADHTQPSDPSGPHHDVRVISPVNRWLGDAVQVNSTHHQAVNDPGEFRACGWAADGLIEVIAHPTHPFAVGVQWHPELLGDDRLYQALLQAAKARQQLTTGL